MQMNEIEKDVAVKGGQMEHVVSLNVDEERIGAILQYQVDHLDMTSLNCPHCRSSNRLAPFGVDVRPAFNQIFTEGIVVIDRSPLHLSAHTKAMFSARKSSHEGT